MCTIVHLSDLHLGRVNQGLAAPLTGAVKQIHPKLRIVFGDLTQRAQAAEFRQAKMFLKTLAMLQIIVPRNHDVSLHNVCAQFIQPLEHYRRHITSDLESFFLVDEDSVRSVNTARSSTIKDGRITTERVHALLNSVIKLSTCV